MVKGEGKVRQNKATGEFEIKREGKENRERIFDFIYDNKDGGARSRDIINNTGLSKEAVHNHLQVLLDEGRVYKKARRYYPEISIQNEFVEFGKIMREGFFKLIDKEMIESSSDDDLPYELGEFPRLKLHQKINIDVPDKILTRHSVQEASFIHSPMYLMRMLCGPITSEKYCKTDFRMKESLEKCLFEFSNRIGAYITYIFLQSLFPLQESKLSDKDRREVCKNMVQKAISTEDLFMFFRDLITQLGLTNNDLEKVFELSDNNFKTISKGLQNVYPHLYIGFENWWLHTTLNTLALDAWSTKSSACVHEWHKEYLFKYGPCHQCKKCNHLSSEIIDNHKSNLA